MAALPTDLPLSPTPASPVPARAAGKSVLAPDLTITGNITAVGSVEIQGQIEGTLKAQSVIIGQDGRFKGAVTAENLEVRGRMDGKASCANLTLRAAAQVTTDANYTTLVIESGAQIAGRFTRPKD
jgi:cytoskeletal protein CcmA (bactofilin family)